MNNSQFVLFLAARLGCAPERAENDIAAIVKWLADTVVGNGKLILRDFGKFAVEKRDEYIVVDAATKKRTLMPPQLSLRFVPYPLLDEQEKNEFYPMEKVAEVLADQQKIAANVAENTVVAFFKALLLAINNEDEVTVNGLGAFQLTKVQLSNRIYGKVTFRPDEAVADLVNRPFSYFQPVELREDVSFDDTEVFSDSVEPSAETDTFVIKSLEETTEQQPVPEAAEQKSETVEPQPEPEAVEPQPEPETAEPQPELETVEPKVEPASEAAPSAVVPATLPASEEHSDDDARREMADKAEPETPAKPRRNFTGLAVLLGLVLIIGLVVLFFNNTGNENEDRMASEESSLASDSTMVAETESPDSLATEETADTIDFDAMNAQIPYGAYDIVAIDTSITVVPGQTALSISKMMLGTEHIIYIVVANDGNDQPQPGEQYRIPRLQLRSKK